MNGPENKKTETDRPPGSYYYDDATGYEVYDPDAVEDEEDDESEDDGHG